MTSKRLLFGAVALAAMGLAAAPASARPRGVGPWSGAAIHRTGMTHHDFAVSGRVFDRARVGGIGSSRGIGRGWDRGRSAHAQIGWSGWRRGGWDRGWGWGGWGWGVGAGIGFGLAAADWAGGWDYPGYYDTYDAYDTGPVFDVSPGFVGVGFGPTWGGTWGGWW